MLTNVVRQLIESGYLEQKPPAPGFKGFRGLDRQRGLELLIDVPDSDSVTEEQVVALFWLCHYYNRYRRDVQGRRQLDLPHKAAAKLGIPEGELLIKHTPKGAKRRARKAA